MTMGLTYATYVTQVAQLAVVDPTDANFVAILPMMITYAENRIYRDLDFLSTVQTNSTYATSSGSRSVTIPVGGFVTLQNVNVVTPTGTSDPNAGTRNPLIPVTKEFLDNVYGNSNGATVPQYF